MGDLGHVEGTSFVIESRFAEGGTERLPGLADDLVRPNVDVMVTAGRVATGAAQRASDTIPIVMSMSADLVGYGLVRSLAHSEGNITGISDLGADTGPKLLEMLRSVAPGLSRVAVLVSPASSLQLLFVTGIQSAAQGVGFTIVPVQVRTAADIDSALSATTRGKAGAVIVVRDAVFLEHRRQIGERAAANRLSTVSDNRDYVDAGP